MSRSVYSKSGKSAVQTALSATLAFLFSLPNVEKNESTFVREIVKSVFGDIEERLYSSGRFTYNEVRKSGMRRVKLFVKDAVKLKGSDMYLVKKMLENVFQGKTVSVKFVTQAGSNVFIQKPYLSVRIRDSVT